MERRSLGIAVLAAVLVAVVVAPAFAGAPTERLREFFRGVDAILADPTTESEPLERVARVKRLVTDIADVRSAAAAALGGEWQARSLAERDQFTALFADLLERAYVARLAGTISAKNGVAMAYRNEVRTGDEARVTTTVRSRDGREVTVEYRMTERQGRWFVRDVSVDDISTVENYRAQFRRLLRQGTYADLVRHLREKLGEETLMFAAVPRAPRAVAASAPEEAPWPPAPPVIARPPAKPAAPARAAALAKAPKVAPAPVAPEPRIAAAPREKITVIAAPAKITVIAAPKKVAVIAAPPEKVTVVRPAPKMVVASAPRLGPFRSETMDISDDDGFPDVTRGPVVASALVLGIVGLAGTLYVWRRAPARSLRIRRVR